MTDDQEFRCRTFFYSLEDIPKVLLSLNHDFAQYNIYKDEIIIPVQEDYELEFMWSTVFHELSHRQFFRYRERLPFEIDDDAMALGEVVAEAGAAFLCRQAGIFDLTRQHHIDYIEGWKLAVSNKSLLPEVTTVVIAMMEELMNKTIYIVDVPAEIRSLFLGK